MAEQPIPTLSVAGLEYDPVKKANIAFFHYLRSLNSQSTIHSGSIKSYSHRDKQAGMDAPSMSAAVEKDLKTIYTSYFDYVDVKVKYKFIDDTPVYRLIISGVLGQNNVSYEISKELEFNDGILSEIGVDYV